MSAIGVQGWELLIHLNYYSDLKGIFFFFFPTGDIDT